MRPWLVHLLCWCALLLPAGTSLAQLSEKMREQIRETLPKFDPQAAATKPAGSAVGTPAPLSDDPAVQLPVFNVFSPRGPASGSDSWLTTQGRQEKALKEYKNSMTALEWVLNCWSIPLLTPSLQTRANAAHEENKIAAEARQLSTLMDAVSNIDPDYARKLARDLDFSRHPGD